MISCVVIFLLYKQKRWLDKIYKSVNKVKYRSIICTTVLARIKYSLSRHVGYIQFLLQRIIHLKKIIIVRLLRGRSFFSSPPQRPMTSDFKGFSIPDVIYYIYFPILILKKEPVFSLLNVHC